MKERISTSDLDRIAGLGLEDLRECFSDKPREGSRERAELTLKILGQSTKRMSAENNQLSVLLKIGKAASVSAEGFSELWRRMGLPAANGQSTPAPELTASE